MDDEGQIRQVVATWHAASRSGDVDTVLGLMTDDVVFLVPGRAPMQRAGHTLTVLRRVSGKWLLARDANLLS